MYNYAQMCPMTLFYYLIREEPFTTQHIYFQNGKFDYSNRIFQSIQLTMTKEDMFSELIPEFFFDSDFLINKNDFDLGYDGSNVKLPKWAINHYYYIYFNRKALESKITSSKITR